MIALSPTALRLLRSLPAYYSDNEWMQRLLQGFADEIDLADARIDAWVQGAVPGAADDTFGWLSMWERTLQLPVAPAGVSVADRQAAVRARWAARNAVRASSVMTMLANLAGAAVTVQRNTPGNLQDTLTIAAPSTSWRAGRAATEARRAWPAHRSLTITFVP